MYNKNIRMIYQILTFLIILRESRFKWLVRLVVVDEKKSPNKHEK